jgi:hypothetical protein
VPSNSRRSWLIRSLRGRIAAVLRIYFSIHDARGAVSFDPMIAPSSVAVTVVRYFTARQPLTKNAMTDDTPAVHVLS